MSYWGNYSLTVRRLVWPLLAVVLMCLTTTGTSAQQVGTESGEFVLRAPAALVQEIAARHGLTIVRQLDGQNLFLVRRQSVSSLRVSALTADGSSPTDSQLTDVTSDPQVLSFEPNSTIVTPEVGVPALSGSVVSILDGLGDTHQVNYYDNQVWSAYVDQPATAAIGLAAGRAAAGTGAGIVAVIDTGVDPGHAALAGSLVPGYDFIHETEGIASEWTDVDGSVVSILDGSVVSILDGSVVSILDGSVVSILDGSVVAILDQQTVAALDPSQLPRAFGHGTMVAGLVHLVAPTAKIMPLKAFKADGTSTVFDVVRAIYYAIDHGARVINMSFSAATASPEITHAINEATSRGVICVASAGNLGQETLVYPGALRNVVGVGSTTSTTPAVRSSFSNYGDALVSLAAPGEGVITTYPGGHYAAAWGTSFSAPLVAGGASLLLQVDPSVDQGKAADLLGKAQPMTGGMGKGRLNLAQAVQSVADRTAPSVAITSPTSGGALFGSVLISASASDNVAVAGVRFLLDDSPIGAEVTAAPFQQMWATAALANGTHTLAAIARDAAGNQSTTSVNITLSNDTSAPTVVLTGPSGGVLSGEVTVSATASDDLEVRGVQFTVDGAPLGDEVTTVPFDATWNTTTVANGLHTISAIARDAAGHASTATVEVMVANDGAAPSVVFTSPAQAAIVQGSTLFVASASDDIGVVGVQFMVDGVSAGAEDSAAPYELSWNSSAVSNGTHAVTAVARDAQGRQATATMAVTVRNDSEAPSVELLTPVAGASVSGIVGILAAAVDDVGVVGVQLKVDGVAVGPEDTEAPYQALWNTADASNGTHAVSVVARDAAGHQSSATLEVTVANDNSAPTIALTSSASGTTVSGMVSFLATASDDVDVVSVQFGVDGAVAEGVLRHAPYQWSWNTAAFANGPHTVTAVARDAVGHQTTASAEVTVGNDNAAPTLALSSSATGDTASGMVSFVAAASDDIGVVSVQFAVDGMMAEGELTSAPYRWSWNTIAFDNGPHIVTAIARDAAGHETTANLEVVVLNDRGDPNDWTTPVTIE